MYNYIILHFFNNLQGIEECEQKIEEVSANKEKFEEEKTKLLSTLRTETKSLQEKKEVIENKLVGLKKTADETKSVVSDLL